MQEWSIRLAPEHRRERARQHLIRQNRLARKIGLTVTRLSLAVLGFTVVFWMTWWLLRAAADSGLLVKPQAPSQGLENRFGD